MVAVTLDGKARSLELPPECVSVAQATSFFKSRLGAAWAHVWSPEGLRVERPIKDVPLTELESGSSHPDKKRVFLTAKGWHPGGTIGQDAGLLTFGYDPYTELPATELPASLLRVGLLQLRAFTAAHAQVTVELPSGRTLALPVFEVTRGSDVAAYIAPLLGCAPNSVRLWCHDTDCWYDNQQVVPGTRFHASVYSGAVYGSMVVIAKTLTGKPVTMSLAPHCTVEGLKEVVQEREGIPPDQQRLIFGGAQLDGYRTLESYGIGHESVVHLVLRLRGGMFAPSSGRAGDFEQLGLGADERQVEAITAAGRIPLEVVLPDGKAVLLSCHKRDGPQEILKALREHLRAESEAAVLAANVDGLQDPAAMRELLRQAQAALRRRQP